jgi:hypothetical protein
VPFLEIKQIIRYGKSPEPKNYCLLTLMTVFYHYLYTQTKVLHSVKACRREIMKQISYNILIITAYEL